MENPAQQLAIIAAALDTDPRRAVASARKLGFAGIEFDAISPQLDLTQLSQTGRRDFRGLLATQNQSLVALRVDAGPNGFSAAADVDRHLSQMTKIMEAAKVVTVPPMVCLEVGPLPEPPPSAKPKPRVTQEQAGLIIIPELKASPEPETPSPALPDPSLFSASIDSVLRELGDRADRIGVTIALRSDLSSYAAIDRAISAAACPWFALDLDPVAILRDDWQADEVFSRLGPLIRHINARDALSGANKRTKPAPIGQGSTEWPTLLNNLESTGYKGWLTINPLELPDRPAAAVSGAEYLRSISTTARQLVSAFPVAWASRPSIRAERSSPTK